MKKIGYYIAVTFLWLVSILPMWLLYLISNGLYYLLYYVIGYRHKIIVNNLKNSFPEKSEKEIKHITKRFYRHLCDLAVETIALITISQKSINKRMVYKNPEILNRFYEEGRPVIGVLGHYGNWEWGCNFALHTNYKAATTYKSIDDKNFDGFFKRLRSRFGFTPVKMHDTIRYMIRQVRSGEKIMLMLIADQTPALVELDYYTTFLGQDTPVFLGPEKLSKALDAPLIFVDMRKLKRGYYQVEFVILNEHPKETEEYELTNIHVKYLEEVIREKPEYWLWSHRRWKYSRTNV